MQKSKAKELVKIINYFANEMAKNVWEAETEVHYKTDWEIKVYLKNSAYRHELSALMMLINSTITVSVFQEVDDSKLIFWRIW